MTPRAVAGRLNLRPHLRVPRWRATPALVAAGVLIALAATALPSTSPGTASGFPIDGAVREFLPKEATPPRPASFTGGVLATEVDALAKLLSGKYRISRHATRDLVRTAYREGARIGIDPLLILAVVGVESRFNPLAESDSGAVGLMQIIPRFHADKYDSDAGQSVLDPQVNIHVGAKVLKEYIARDGSQVAGLQRYNGSSGDPSNAYANKVLGERQWLQRALKDKRPDLGA